MLERSNGKVPKARLSPNFESKPSSGYKLSLKFTQFTLADEANYNLVLTYELLLQKLQ